MMQPLVIGRHFSKGPSCNRVDAHLKCSLGSDENLKEF